MNPGGYELNWPINKPFFVCYPYPDQKNVPTSMKPEIPDPAPDIPEEGFPITVQFPSCYTKWLRVINISLYDENLEEVKTRFLFSGNDRMLNQNEYACLPEKPLKKRTKYKVVLNYTWRESSGVLSWEFMTRDGWW